MRVAVCCKGVPVDMLPECVEVTGGDLKVRGTDLHINEVDDYAMEAALVLKRDYGVQTVALTLGSLKVQEVLHYALAKGVDQAIRVEGETSRPELIASGLMPSLMAIKPALFLVGVQSEDWGGGEVGVYLAHALDMALAYAVVAISDLNDRSVRVKKELGGGVIAELVVNLPAVLCVQSGIQPLQYVSAVKRKKARTIPVEPGGKLDLAVARQNIPGMMAYSFKEVILTPREGHAQILTGTRPEQAAKLLGIIRNSV